MSAATYTASHYQLSLDVHEMRTRGYADPELGTFSTIGGAGTFALWRHPNALYSFRTYSGSEHMDWDAARDLIEQHRDFMIEHHAHLALEYIRRHPEGPNPQA